MVEWERAMMTDTERAISFFENAMENCVMVARKPFETALAALRRTAEDDKAREEGRLHIAPIADGTTIFRPVEYNELFDEPAHVCEDSYVYGYTEIVYGEMGKGWYLTRQEAEAALDGGGEGD